MKPSDLTTEHFQLARNFAKRHCPGDMSEDEAYSAALLGLCEAAKRFDETKGAKFHTYAFFWMRREVMQEWRDLIRSRVISGKRVGWVDNLRREIAERKKSEVTLELVAKKINRALKSIPEREADVLRKRSQGETLKVVGEEMGICRERVRQLESRGLRLMRRKPQLRELVEC